MAVSEELKKFRRQRASELEQFARAINKLENCNPYPIYQAADQLKDFTYVPKISAQDMINYNYWGYDLEGLTFSLDPPPRHDHIGKIYNVTLRFSIKVIADYNDFNKVRDPFKHLELNIVISGNNILPDQKIKEVITCYHIDRHLSSDTAGEPEDIHPIYHLQYGGRFLDQKYFDFGNTFILHSPRIVHYPMDLILGVDFVLSNFLSSKWKEQRSIGEYVNLIREYQNYFWKPYAHTKASHWKPYEQRLIEWSPIQIWPNLMN
ncbi:MAG: hypothetical protein KA096_00035 [Bacteroidales bacterium]|nr:hypothetical protein [Bacteroidales bacterium]